MTAVKNIYEHLLLRNLSAVQQIESGIRNITWLLPGRFEDSEIASEGCKLKPCFPSIHLIPKLTRNPSKYSSERSIRISRYIDNEAS